MELFDFAVQEVLFLSAYGVGEEIVPSISAVGFCIRGVGIVEFTEVSFATAQAGEGFGGGDVEMLGEKGGGAGGSDQVAGATFLDHVREGGVEKCFLVEGLLQGDGGIEMALGQGGGGCGVREELCERAYGAADGRGEFFYGGHDCDESSRNQFREAGTAGFCG